MGNRTAFSIHQQKARKRQSAVRKQKTGGKGLGLLCFCFLLFTLYSSLFTVLSFAGDKKDEKAPTIITSRTLNADNKAKTALFEGNVVAKKGEMTIFADKMLVFYAEEKGGSNIKKIDAEGNVKLIKGDRVVTSGFATYFAEPEEHIVFTGEPRATEGDNVVTGTKMTSFIKDDRSVVENSKVFLVEKKRGGGPR